MKFPRPTRPFSYDPVTFLVRRILTVRASDNATLQDLNYTYDPIGNITQIRDAAQQTIYFNNQIVSPQNDFIYDAIYRIVSATGREHIGQNAPVSEFDANRTNLAHPADGNAMQRYLQQYDYDGVGNMLAMVHSSGSGPFINQWTRHFTPSVINNQLSSSQVGARLESYSYDVHGNMTAIPGMPTLNWDFNNQFRSVDLGGGGTAYYSYDAAGKWTSQNHRTPERCLRATSLSWRAGDLYGGTRRRAKVRARDVASHGWNGTARDDRQPDRRR